MDYNLFPHTGIISIGDWSDDGHGRCEMFEFKSTHPLDQLQNGYKKSKKISGISFDHENMESEDPNAICVEWRSGNITNYQMEMLHRTFRLDISDIPENVKNFSMQGIEPSPKELAHIILWFSGQTLDGFKFKILEQVKRNRSDSNEFFEKTFNGWWSKNLNVQFGYGLFDRGGFGGNYYIQNVIKKLDENKKIHFSAHVLHFIDLPFKVINSPFLSSSINYSGNSRKEFIEWCNKTLSGNVFKKGKLYFYENIEDIYLLEKFCKSREYVLQQLPHHVRTKKQISDELIKECTKDFGKPMYKNSIYPDGMMKFDEDAKWDFVQYINDEDEEGLVISIVAFKNKADAMAFKLKA